MRFESGRGWILGFFLLVVVLVMIGGAAMLFIQGGGLQWLSIVVILAIFFPLWPWFRNYYEIKDDSLYYHCGWLNGIVQISEIHNITVGELGYRGLNVGSDIRGCIIKYGKNNGIYVSPKDKENFIAELLKINPAIKVFRKQIKPGTNRALTL